MEARPSKRRKVSPEPSTTAKQAKARAAIDSARHPTTEAVLQGPKPSDLWREAKAKRLAQRSEKEVDVYDFEATQSAQNGMHKRRPGNGSGSASKQKESSQRRVALDPLKNQRSAHDNTPRKSGTTVGFFKKFAKQDVHPSRAVDQQLSSEKSHANQPRRKDQENIEDEPAASPTSALQATKKAKVKPSWHYEVAATEDGEQASTPTRKTFEDEIKELAEIARKEAEAEAEQSGNDEEEEGTERTGRRASGRKPVPRKQFEPKHTPRPKAAFQPTVRQKVEVAETEDEGDGRSAGKQSSARKPRSQQHVELKPTSRPKLASQANGETAMITANPARLPLEQAQVEAEDPMEMDDSEGDEQETPKPVSRLRLKPDDAVVAKKTKAPSAANVSQHGVAQPAPVPTMTFPLDTMKRIRSALLDRATRKRPIPLVNLEDEYTKVYTLINQTVAAGESNSMLVIGARGSGKSTLVNQILQKQQAEHPDDFHVVRLSGFIHTDDKIALWEIWRQLGREMELDDEESATKNYADTLTTLLALLSHPAENGTHQPGQVAKSVIFVIDEFELFASHPRQTLLYNLFDMAQSRKAPIAVLGLTTRIDVAESLEKRVKSRFSHRYVHLSQARSFQAFEQICSTAMMILDPGELSGTGRKSIEDWNTLVHHIVSTEALSTALRRLYCTTKSVPDFLTALILPLAALPLDDDDDDDGSSRIDSSALLHHFTSHFSSSASALRPPDSKLDLLPALSTLQLALLVCAARLTAIYATDVVSFNLAYDEYKTLASKARLQASASGAIAQGAGSRVWGKAVARGAWEALMACGLVMEDGRAGGGSGRVDVGLEEMGACGVELGQWARWCREI